jgi:hypothetical protein
LTSPPNRTILLSLKTTSVRNPKKYRMQYKTIILRLLVEQRPEIQARLKRNRQLLPTLDRVAKELKASHEAYQESLSRSNPGRDSGQIASEALELALKDLVGYLQIAFPPEGSGSQDENEPLSLDAAMAFVRRHTPPT